VGPSDIHLGATTELQNGTHTVVHLVVTLALQTRRSRIRFPKGVSGIFIDVIIYGVDSDSNRNKYRGRGVGGGG